MTVRWLCIFLFSAVVVVTCSKLNFNEDIENGSLRNRKLFQDHETKSATEVDKSTFIITQSWLPSRVSLDHYGSSLAINILIYINNYQYKYDCSSVKTFFSITLFTCIFQYFWLTPENELGENVPTVSFNRWLMAPLSWITESLLILPTNLYQDLSNNYHLPDESVLCFIFLLQMLYFFSAYDYRGILSAYKRSIRRRY